MPYKELADKVLELLGSLENEVIQERLVDMA